jgi:hypothetical protein
MKRIVVERGLVLEGMQDYAFKQITKRKVVVFGKCFEHFDHSLFHPHADLHALDGNFFYVGVFFKLGHDVPLFGAIA